MRAQLRQLVREYRRRLIWGGLLLFLFIFGLAYTGFYPVAVVNGQWITARRFYTHLAAARNYEQSQSSSTTFSALKGSNLAVAVLEGLIEDQIIEEDARAEFASRFDPLLAERVKSFLEQSNAIETERTRYGLSTRSFEREILRPQVIRDLLSGRLFLRSMRLEDWLYTRKKTASVAIFSQTFYWDGQMVQAKP